MKLILDFDQQMYASGFATEGEPLSHTLRTIKVAINRQIRESGCTDYQIYIQGTGNFRDDIASDYKATRPSRKPAAMEDIREYLITKYNAEVVNGIETDDKVSMILWEDFIACDGIKERASIMLSSPDKDLKNTPGWHYFPKSGKTAWISDDQARRHFQWQLLCGDKVDNIKGLPLLNPAFTTLMGLGRPPAAGCGEVWAKKVMHLASDVHEAEINVYRAYLSYGEMMMWSEDQTYEYLTQQGQLLWMLRGFDSYGNPLMWEPTEELWDVARRRERGRAGPDGRDGYHSGLPERKGSTETRGHDGRREAGVFEEELNQERIRRGKERLAGGASDDDTRWAHSEYARRLSGDTHDPMYGSEDGDGRGI